MEWGEKFIIGHTLALLAIFLPCSNSEPVHRLFEMFHAFSCNNLGGHLGALEAGSKGTLASY